MRAHKKSRSDGYKRWP